MTTTRSKRGRKPITHITSWGEEVPGLYRCPDGRWRIKTSGQKFTEPDERRAVAKFRQIEAKQNRRDANIQIPHHPENIDPDDADAVDAVLRHELGPGEHRAAGDNSDDSYILKIPDNADPIALLRSIPEQCFWTHVAEEIFRRPQYVAQITGIEQIGYLADLPKPTPSPTLEEVGELYFTKPRITAKWQRQSRLFWREFCDSVDVRTLREVSQEKVAAFKANVLDVGQSSTYIKHRFSQIKRIINYSKEWGKWADDRARALAYCAILIPPTSTTIDPHPISREDFTKLYNAANEQMQAVLLLALNSCMYAAEVSDILWSSINLDTGTLVMDRGKTKVARVAVLWPRTITALKKLPRITERLFITEATRQPHNANTIGKYFSDLRVAANISDEVKFRDIRDGAYTAACAAQNIQQTHARVLAGHRSGGMTDHYVKRSPQMVADACDAIERAYFG